MRLKDHVDKHSVSQSRQATSGIGIRYNNIERDARNDAISEEMSI